MTDKDGETDETLLLVQGRAEHELPPPSSGIPPELPRTEQSVRERIEIRELHSSGGIGEVWLAYDQVLGREIALKRLRPDQSAIHSHRVRFAREAKITGQLEHPGIVPVYTYDANADGSHCHYTMRFLRGATLHQVIAQFHARRGHAALSLDGGGLLSLLRQFVTVCKTIAFAHSRGVIHRDIKGENIIVGEFGELVVLDWGLAKRLGEDDPDDIAESDLPAAALGGDSAKGTRQGEQLGTPAYMAPEQALGQLERIDRRTDVYGLAALLYQMLVGRPPFQGDNVQATLSAVVNAPPVKPSSTISGVPADLERICLKGLAKDSADRQQSAAELSSEVESWLNTLAERKRAERERERFFNLSTDLLAIVNEQGQLIQSNSAWDAMLGWSAAARQDASFWSYVLPSDLETARAGLEAAHRVVGGNSHELRMLAADGSFRWIDWQFQFLPDELGTYLVGRDVTERKQTEQELEGLLESAPDATCVIDGAQRLVRVNAQLEQVFGYRRDQLLGQGVEVLVPEHLRKRHRDHVSRFLQAPTPRAMGSGLSLLGQKADGTVFPVEVSLSPVRTHRGLHISCTLRDVSARRRDERRVLAVLEAAPDAMLVIDNSHIVQYVNRRAEALFGYARAELIGQPLEKLIPARYRAGHRSHVARYATAPTPRTMGAGRVLRARHKDGSEFAVDISLNAVQTEDGLMISSAIRPAQS